MTATSSTNNTNTKNNDVSENPKEGTIGQDALLLPVLIIPGFMSSGLEIVESTLKPSWKSQRIWLNLASLGLSAIYFGSSITKTHQNTNDPPPPPPSSTSGTAITTTTTTTGEDESTTQLRYKSTWLEHMRLNPRDCKTETDGVQVRAILGLEGVDYLTPGMFTNLVSYVFGPVIHALANAGYQTDGTNLQAAPYDWRLPPSELERRDQYFTRTMEQVERMYMTNQKTPVVLLSHSLGTKTAHYFLNFCLAQKGQEWIDQYIHTYIPVGAPHLGAPKALRSLITGDKMGLDAFLSDSEGLILGRSFGSGAWLLPPELPAGVPPNAYVLPQGTLHISFVDKSSTDTAELTERRLPVSIPHRFQLMAVLVGTHQGESQTVVTPFYHAPNTIVHWDNGQFCFATPPKAPPTDHPAKLQFILNEPGIKAAKYERPTDRRFNPILCLLNWLLCCCLWTCLCRIVATIIGGVAQALVLSADSLSSLTSKQATPLALSDVLNIPPSVWKGKSVRMDVTLVHADDYGKVQQMWCSLTNQTQRTTTISVELKWTPHQESLSLESQQCSPISQPSMTSTKPVIRITRPDGQAYVETSGYDILQREGLQTSLRLMKEDYDADPLAPRTTQAPPIRRIHAIYGTNLPTETGAVYRKVDSFVAPGAPLQSLYALDTRAKTKHPGHHVVDHGLLIEKPVKAKEVDGINHCSGDGTVPYWSLKHVETWRSATCHVTVQELPRAEHREILADSRFHECLIRYLRIPKETA